MSAKQNSVEIDLRSVKGDAESAARGIEFGAELMLFAGALARRDQLALEAARFNLLELAGAAVLVDAAGVAANFQRMVRIADSIGIPIDDMHSELGRQIRADTGIESFPSARNSLEI